MRILGIDPGLATMGWGVLDTEGSKSRLVKAGAVITPPDMPIQRRLHSIFLGVKELILAYQPEEIVFEELFFAKNITTAMNVSAARGVALCACADSGLPMYEYTPMQIKQAITGYGKADKKQIQQMVKLLLKLDEVPRPDDAADAIACAITHCQAGVAKSQFLMK